MWANALGGGASDTEATPGRIGSARGEVFLPPCRRVGAVVSPSLCACSLRRVPSVFGHVAATSVNLRRFCPCLARRGLQRLLQIGDDVVDVLDADGEPDEFRARTRGFLRFRRQLLVGRARRMDDEGFRVADVRQQ